MVNESAEELGRGCRVVTVEKVKSLITEERKSILEEVVASLSRSIADDIKDSLTAELSAALKASLSVTFVEILDDKLEPIQGEISQMKKDIASLNELSIIQAAEIEKLKQENINLQKQPVSFQNTDIEKKMHDVEERIEERTNRSLRQTLVFKGIQEQTFEVKNYKGDQISVPEKWSDTTDILSSVIAKACDTDIDETRDWINRAHRSAPNKNKQGKRDIFANFFSWEVTQDIIKGFRNYNMANKTFKVYVDYKFGPLTSSRRNEALKVRGELKREGTISKGYVKYPALLMVVKKGESRFTEHADYSKMPVTFNARD